MTDVLEQTSRAVRLSTDKSRLQIDVIHHFLRAHSYWASGISKEDVKRYVRNSLCVGAYLNGTQIGFARWVTDSVTVAYLCDVFVVPSSQKQNVGLALMSFAQSLPEVQGVRVRLLATRDAHPFYERCGWRLLSHPERFMELPTLVG